MSFVFTPSPHFVRPDAEQADRVPDQDTAEDVALLRQLYPELAGWGDLPLTLLGGAIASKYA